MCGASDQERYRRVSIKLFVWIVDYIKAARELQLALYDQTNIEINPANHISAIALANGSASSSYEEETYDYGSTGDYETHYYTDYESTTRKSIFGWLPNNDETRDYEVPTNIFNFGETTTEYEYPYYNPETEYDYTNDSFEGYLPEEEGFGEGALPEDY